jgi:hypothetical protein
MAAPSKKIGSDNIMIKEVMAITMRKIFKFISNVELRDYEGVPPE